MGLAGNTGDEAPPCPECGAPVPAGGACIDRFHALLGREQDLAAAGAFASREAGERAHYHAVGAYVLQHPETMRYTAGSLAGLRTALAANLAGRTTMAETRAVARAATDGATRVTRRPGDPVPSWGVAAWPTTVVDVLDDEDGAPDAPGAGAAYAARVAAWAADVLATLDGAPATPKSVSAPRRGQP